MAAVNNLTHASDLTMPSVLRNCFFHMVAVNNLPHASGLIMPSALGNCFFHWYLLCFGENSRPYCWYPGQNRSSRAIGKGTQIKSPADLKTKEVN